MTRLRGEARARAKGLAFLSPWLIGFCGFTLVPIGLSLYYSFCRYSLLQPPLFKGLENYSNLVQDAVFWKALRNTAVYSLVALPLGMIASLGIAMLLNSKIRGVAIYRTIVFLPSLAPAVASDLFSAAIETLTRVAIPASGLLSLAEQPTVPVAAIAALVVAIAFEYTQRREPVREVTS